MSIFNMIYQELQAKIEHLPEYKNNELAKKTFDYLDHEWITDIILDDNTFWFEYPTYGGFDDDVYDWLVSYIKQHGYEFLWDKLPVY